MDGSKGKAVIIGGGALALLGLAFAGTSHAAEAPKKAPPKRPMTDKEKAVALALKYASAFGVPSSLVLAILSVQSNWRTNAQNPRNKRGGAWGIGQVTLKTAQDLNTRFPTIARKWWPSWDGTGPGLLDPSVNIAMTAFMLSLAWKRYKARPENWLVTLLSYHQGMGGMDKLLKQGGGKLPATLPPNATIMKARFNKVRAGGDSVVTRAYQNEHASGLVGELENTVNTKTNSATTANINALAAQLKTRDQCRAALGEAAKTLNKAYPVINDAPLVATWAGLRTALRDHVDNINRYAQKVYADIDEAVHDPSLTSFWPDFSAAIRQIINAIGKGVASAIPTWVWGLGAAGVGLGALALIKK
jgi:hypothetical protein